MKSVVCSLRFRLMSFNLIASKVEVKSERLSLYITKLHRSSKNIQLYSHSHGPFIK